VASLGETRGKPWRNAWQALAKRVAGLVKVVWWLVCYLIQGQLLPVFKVFRVGALICCNSESFKRVLLK
jgi:hypothetical protein